MKILITGAAGFIGFHLVKKLVACKNTEIVGIDNINNYYDVQMKYDRLAECGIEREHISENSVVESVAYNNYKFGKIDITDYQTLFELFKDQQFDYVINMAAQAGVRYSIENPHSYVQSNMVGFTNILECCRYHSIKHFIYASSSSVYGMNNKIPFSEDDNVDYPVSFYAATKKSNELMAHAYSHIYSLPTTGVRLFTVYGPWGRPDMAPMLFARAIHEGKTIQVYNYGDMLRDFTYIDDIVEGIIQLIGAVPDQTLAHPYYQIFNIGNSKPVKLMDFISTIEKNMGKKAVLKMMPIPPADVKITYADTTRLEERIHYKPATSLDKGIARFIDWAKGYCFAER